MASNRQLPLGLVCKKDLFTNAFLQYLYIYTVFIQYLYIHTIFIQKYLLLRSMYLYIKVYFIKNLPILHFNDAYQGKALYYCSQPLNPTTLLSMVYNWDYEASLVAHISIHLQLWLM